MSKHAPRSTPRRSAPTGPVPSRPDLDQLRTQSKQLLARLRDGDKAAVREFIAHLPEARDLTPKAVLEAGYRLADAQSAVARRSGFASWPALARHVQILRALEGTWRFASLEIEGLTLPSAMLGASHILIDGDRFRTESPEATYDGVFLIDVEASPCTIDIDFVEGPEAGNRSRGIFTLDGDVLTICLGLTGATRPTEFRTTKGSRHALERLERASAARPAGVTGGKASGAAHVTTGSPAPQGADGTVDFARTPCALDETLAGEWSPLEVVRDGKALPAAWLSSGRRVASADEVQVVFGGQTMLHARVRYDDRVTPWHVDFLYLAGEAQGKVANGICEWDGRELRVNMAPPGAARPTDWRSDAGSGRVLSRWARR